MIKINHVAKRFGQTMALNDVSFSVQPGQVVGFLGPNGAGKSTCLRILSGLVQPDSGQATIDDQPYRQLKNPAAVVGALLSAECFHPSRTGREALLMAAITAGIPADRVDQVLCEVGLSQAEAKRRVGKYSLGMRQRLGVALAILGDPHAIILDEPANGLDPQGQRWIFDLIRARAERGCAVLLSSHQLHEVGQLADQIIMIGHGRLLTDQPVVPSSVADLEEEYFALTGNYDRADLSGKKN